MNTANRRHSWFELVMILLFVLLASHKAFVSAAVIIMPIGHTILLVSAYLFLRILARRLHENVGRAVFATAILLLLGELALQSFTGFHLNLFILKVLMQPDAGDHIGLPLPLIGAVVGLILVTAWFGNKYLHTYNYTLNARFLFAAALAGIILSQTGYAYHFYKGNSQAIIAKRHLPFFTSFHHYYITRYLQPILGDREANPFSLMRPASTKKAPHDDEGIKQGMVADKTSSNLLLVVMDSLRSQDIISDPTLIPNLQKWSKKGWINLQHYSTSSCTHFSFYSLLTGKLSTSFAAAREKGYAPSIVRELAAGGWSVSLAEANSLNWYEIDSLLLPPTTKRTLTQGENKTDPDTLVTTHTIQTLRQNHKTGTPFAHIAYYYGSHFPYTVRKSTANIANTPETNLGNYRQSIRNFDHEMGNLLSELDTSGILENTLVLITSDHGESLNENGYIGHGRGPYQEEMVVPLLAIPPTSSATQTHRPRSHREVPDYIRGILSGKVGQNTRAESDKPIVLAYCDYAYPPGFVVLLDGAEQEFLYENGYLVPVTRQDQTPDFQKRAALHLLEEIRKSEITP